MTLLQNGIMHVLFLSFYSAGRHAAVYLLLEYKEEHQNRDNRNQHARADIIVLVSIRPVNVYSAVEIVFSSGSCRYRLDA